MLISQYRRRRSIGFPGAGLVGRVNVAQNLRNRDDGFDGYFAIEIQGGEYFRKVRIPPDLDSVPKSDIQDDFGKFAAARGDNARNRTRSVRVRLQGGGDGIFCLLLFLRGGKS